MTWQIFDRFRLRQNNGNSVNLDVPGGNGFKIAIITSTLAPDQNLHDFWSDLSANEVSGTNYTAGGNLCATPSITGPDAAGLCTFDAADPATWPQSASGFSNGRYAILYRDSGTGSTSELVAYEDFVTDKGNVAGDFSITLDAAGIFTLPR